MKTKTQLLLIAGLLALMPLSAAAQDLAYVDAKTLTIINKAQTDETPLQRIDVEKYPDLTPTVTKYYRYPTGLAVVFRTDSKNLTARWTTTSSGASSVNTPLIATRGLDLYILQDGKWIWAGVGKPSKKLEHESKIVSNMDGTMHECLLYLPLFTEVTSLEIGYDDGAVMEAVPNPFKHKIVVVGSSLTHGSGVSRPAMAYPARLERRMGFQFVNLGASGQCKLDEFYAKIVADTQADAFVFDTFSNPNAEQIVERLATFVKIVREAHPTTPLIFLQTIMRESCNFNVKERETRLHKRAVVVSEMEKILAEYKDIYFINPAFPLGDDHEGTGDGVHPTDLGTESVLAEMEPRLREIFTKCGIE